MSDFTIDKAQLLALLLSSVFYGIFLVSFFMCMRVLLWDRGFKPKSTIRWPMVCVAVVLATIGTINLGYTFNLNFRAFILYDGPGGPIAVFNDISYWASVLQSVHVEVSVCIGDAVLIYRCYYVYGQSWRIIVIPTILWLAGIACGCCVIWIEATLGHLSTLLHLAKVQPFLTSFTGLTVAQNIITTSAIIYRIWCVDRATAQYRATNLSLNHGPKRSKLKNIMRIIIESGLLYTSIAIVSFVLFITNSSAFYTTTYTEIPVIGIAFNLIIIRADKQSAEEYTVYPTGPSATLHFTPGNELAGSAGGPGIQLSVVRETHDDSFRSKTDEFYDVEARAQLGDK